MKVTLEKVPPSQVKFGVEIEGSHSQAVYDRLVKQLVASMQVPGFRRGKAPRELVLRQAGAENIKATVLEEIIESSAEQILADYDKELETIGDFRIAGKDKLLAEFEIGKPFSFELLIDVHPEVTLKQHKGFHVKVKQVKPDADYADRLLHEYQVRKSTLVPVEDRPAQLGDVVTIDLEVYDPTAGKLLEEFTETDLQIDLDPKNFLPTVVAALVGAKVGDEVEAIATIPESICPPELLGKELRYIAILKDLKMRELPPLDDEFAKSISQKQTIAELRAYLEQQAIAEAEAETAKNTKIAVLDALVAQMEVEIPLSILQGEVKLIMQQRLEELQERLGEEALKNLMNNRQIVNHFMRSVEPEALLRVKRSLALDKVAKLENITVPEAELQTAIEKNRSELAQPPSTPEEESALRMLVMSYLVVEKTIDWLIANSTIEYVDELPTDEADAPTSELIATDTPPVAPAENT